MSSIITPTELKRRAEEVESKKAQEAIERLRKTNEDERHLREAFMERDLRSDIGDRLTAVVQRAAEAGQHEVLVLKFPAAWTNDHGRRINNNEPDWPASLEGFAKRGHEYYERELRPVGYKLRCQILNYPDGMPGDVGMYLGW